ncbi:helix-turn-helix domain-containing protein [Candidatus Soleaferrea massiliensis]|uniref:helix-turn-helix domain-containing protein n=1 Tax=Candidatus Soleaferrea massiliensis TaxID=1470354 RepID=UPI00069395C5|nr:helix-turn-helix transcriptional regulator [Candidatus Soleaferrea massiliensis]
MGIGDRLRNLREEKDMKQIELAAALNVVPSTISNYENEVSAPEYEALVKLARYFNVSTDYLLGNSVTRMSWEDANTDIKIIGGKVASLKIIENIIHLDLQDRTTLINLINALLNQQKYQKSSNK